MRYSNQVLKINQDATKQVNIKRARKDFNKGFKVYIHPCNMTINNCWQTPFGFQKSKEYELKFDTIVDNFIYYNCDNKLGRYPIFFTTNIYKH